MTIITKESIKVGDKVARLLLLYTNGQFRIVITDSGQISDIFYQYDHLHKKEEKKYFLEGDLCQHYFDDLFGHSSACVKVVSEDSIDQYLDPQTWSDHEKATAVEEEQAHMSLMRFWW